MTLRENRPAVAEQCPIHYIPASHLSKGQAPVSDSTRVKADIVKFTSEYARTVRGWIDSEETAASLGLTDEFPPPEDIVETWQSDDMTGWLLLSGNGPVAYAELWPKPAELAMEIRRLLVDPRRREQGFGCKMLTLLHEAAGRRPEVAKVAMQVAWDNRNALGCYLKAGFTVAGTTHDKPGLYLVRMIERNQ
ncbi:GNAT family N-acetyltransferase [candidate division GN15 bacterium]|nr:GNAT family N-acetyltransferase [candidate division GN15 bacterium]